MLMVKAMTITVDSLLLRLKLDCDVGYNVAMKGASVVLGSPVMAKIVLGVEAGNGKTIMF
jgi:hypothetical protein